MAQMGHSDPIHDNDIVHEKLLKTGHSMYKMHSDVLCCLAGTMFVFCAQSSTKKAIHSP